jgi:NitT/TauT family transport system ATP-binding protein
MEIRFENVRKTFEGRSGPVLALQDINLTIGEGEFICLVGPSGCGKSTLCNMLAASKLRRRGTVSMDGQVVSGPSMSRP